MTRLMQGMVALLMVTALLALAASPALAAGGFAPRLVVGQLDEEFGAGSDGATLEGTLGGLGLTLTAEHSAQNLFVRCDGEFLAGGDIGWFDPRDPRLGGDGNYLAYRYGVGLGLRLKTGAGTVTGAADLVREQTEFRGDFVRLTTTNTTVIPSLAVRFGEPDSHLELTGRLLVPLTAGASTSGLQARSFAGYDGRTGWGLGIAYRNGPADFGYRYEQSRFATTSGGEDARGLHRLELGLRF